MLSFPDDCLSRPVHAKAEESEVKRSSCTDTGSEVELSPGEGTEELLAYRVAPGARDRFPISTRLASKEGSEAPIADASKGRESSERGGKCLLRLKPLAASSLSAAWLCLFCFVHDASLRQ